MSNAIKHFVKSFTFDSLLDESNLILRDIYFDFTNEMNHINGRVSIQITIVNRKISPSFATFNIMNGNILWHDITSKNEMWENERDLTPELQERTEQLFRKCKLAVFW